MPKVKHRIVLEAEDKIFAGILVDRLKSYAIECPICKQGFRLSEIEFIWREVAKTYHEFQTKKKEVEAEEESQ